MRIARVDKGGVSWPGQQVATVTKHGLKWDESAHPRHADGKFRDKGTAAEGNGHAKAQTASAQAEDPQLRAMFAVRDQLVAPRWENPTQDQMIVRWSAGEGADKHDYHLAYYHGRISDINPDADDGLENTLAGVLQSTKFKDAGIGEVAFYQDLGPGSSQVTATGGGNAREVFRHVIGAVSDLMRQREGIIIFTGASDQHDKLYSNLMRLMGKSDPNYVPIATGATGNRYFALVRKDIFEHIDKLPDTVGVDAAELEATYNHLEDQWTGVDWNWFDDNTGIEISEWDSGSAGDRVKRYQKAKSVVTAGLGYERQVLEFEELLEDDPTLTIDAEGPVNEWSADEKRAVLGNIEQRIESWSRVQRILEHAEGDARNARLYAEAAIEAYRRGDLSRAKSQIAEAVDLEERWAQHGKPQSVWAELQEMFEHASEGLRGLTIQRYSAHDGWGLPIKYGAKWDESLHPRDPEGKFTDKGQGRAKMATRESKIDPATLSKEVLARMHKHLKAQGYDVRGAEDVRKSLQERMVRDGKIWHEDWAAAYQKATTGSQAAAKRRDTKASATKHVNWANIKSKRRMPYSYDNYRKAGYLTPDGMLLDYSGGEGPIRNEDHRDGMGTPGMQELMNQGYIRCMPEAGGLDILQPPTPPQRSVIRKLAADLNGELVLSIENGLGPWHPGHESYMRNEEGGRFYHEFTPGTSPTAVLGKIDSYYNARQQGQRFAVRGEYWIQDGHAIDADSDTGMGHADYVVEALMDEAMETLGIDEEQIRDWETTIAEAQRNRDKLDDVTTKTEWWQKLKEAGWSDARLDAMLGTAFASRDSDPRLVGLEEFGWHRVAGNDITTKALTRSSLKQIADGLYDIHGDEVEDMKFNISTAERNGWYQDVPFATIADENPAALRQYKTHFAARGRKPENGIDPIDNLLGGSQGYLYKGGKLQEIAGEHSATVGPIDKAVQAGAVRIRDHGQFVAFQGRSKATVDAAIKAYVRDVGVPKKITAEWPGRFYDDYQGGGTSFAARAHDAGGMRAANATSRPAHFAEKAIVPRLVADHLATHPQGKRLAVLDFGAGKQALHAQALKKRGYNVTAYDFGANVGEQHDPQALDRQYDVVYASNVLNVQETAKMLSKTLSEIRESAKPGGVVFVNLPQPLNGIWRNRKPAAARRLMEQILRKRLGTPEELQKGVWKVTVPGAEKAKKFSRVSGDRLSGGKADHIPVKSFDPQQLLLGTMIEMEHTRNVRLAQEIARDHLAENPNYYQLLSRFVEEPTARPAGENVLRGWRQPGLFSMRGTADKYRATTEQPRSPAPHGVTIGGQFYPPGQWIPAGAMSQATQAQRHAIATNDSTHATADEPDPDTSHLGVEPVALLKRLQRQGLLAHADLAFGHGGIVAQVDGRQFVIRVAREGELEQLWRNDPASASASATAGGIGHIAAIAGAYRNGQIILAEDFTDGEMNHELIHALRDLGIIKQSDIDLWGGEEQMAYAYQRWTDKSLSLAKPVETVFHRIRDFFLALFGNTAAQQRQTLRRFDRGQLQPGVNWGKVAHRAALLSMAAYQVKRNWPEIKRQRKAVQDFLHMAAYGGNYHKAEEPVRPGDVRAADPNTGINDQGIVMTGAVLFSTRNWQEWMDKFDADPKNQALYSQHDREELRKGMEATARIFGDFSQLPDEEVTATPLRDNSDALFRETFDLSTICPMQDLYNAVVRAVQHMVGSIFGKQARHLIGRVIDKMGFKSACYWCYGQSSRNNGAQALKHVAEVAWPAWQQLQSTPAGRQLIAAPNTDPQKIAVMNKMFYGDLANFYWWDKKRQKHSLMYQAFAKYGDNPEVQALMAHPPNIHDLFFQQYQGPPLTPAQADFAEMVRASVQGGIKPNKPKGWAPYNDQIFTAPKKKGLTISDRIQAYNRSAGFRMNSQTDLRPWHILDTSQFLTHLGREGGMAHVYTRVPEFVEIFGGTGIKFNLSCCYSTDLNGHVNKRGGRPKWDMKSFPQDLARKYKKMYPGEVGGMLTATSVEALLTGLDDPEIDMIIPYHAGSIPKAVDVYEGYEDFSPFQHEHWPKGVHRKGDKVTVRINVRGQPKTVDLHWEHPITREHHADDKDQYLAICDALKVTPRFPQLCGRGQQWHATPKASELPMATVNIDHPNYMKVVRDVAVTHTPQRPVDPRKINWRAAERWAQAYMNEGGKESEGRIPKHLLDVVHAVVTNTATEEMRPVSPVQKDVDQNTGLPILDVKKSMRHDALVRRVSFRLNKEIARVRHSAARSAFAVAKGV